MKPIRFEQSNATFRAPAELTENQCGTIDGYVGFVQGGSLDGSQQTVAWIPDSEDLKRLKAGKPVFLSVIGGLPPHFLTTSFEETQRIA